MDHKKLKPKPYKVSKNGKIKFFSESDWEKLIESMRTLSGTGGTRVSLVERLHKVILESGISFENFLFILYDDHLAKHMYKADAELEGLARDFMNKHGGSDISADDLMSMMEKQKDPSKDPHGTYS